MSEDSTRKFHADSDNPDQWYQEDSLGRKRPLPLKGPYERELLPPGWSNKRHGSHPDYMLGYASAVSYEYRMILIDLIVGFSWPEHVLKLAAQLVYPRHDQLSYQDVTAYYQAVAEEVKEVRPALAESLAPFAARHGLDVIPWGTGWLYQTMPVGISDERVDVPMTVPGPPSAGPKIRPTDPRTTPALDALLLYLWVTEAWRDEGARVLLRPLICFDCDVTDSPGCTKPVYFASGSTRPEALKLQINRIKSALGVHRRRGRPKGSSKWDKEELYSVLIEYRRYGGFRREMARHFTVG